MKNFFLSILNKRALTINSNERFDIKKLQSIADYELTGKYGPKATHGSHQPLHTNANYYYPISLCLKKKLHSKANKNKKKGQSRIINYFFPKQPQTSLTGSFSSSNLELFEEK